ncbi:hypothetical protein [Streptomyces sp. RKAG337]|nr:hypothetical protein [Streptomyces sp. RKAG337]MCM2424934.1 hypothetical protein [Streptomyces sp. RKAG337]
MAHIGRRNLVERTTADVEADIEADVRAAASPGPSPDRTAPPMPLA